MSDEETVKTGELLLNEGKHTLVLSMEFIRQIARRVTVAPRFRIKRGSFENKK